ncbi:MAG: PilZ domain-containing protein [Acidobacteria bacterium]|nr:PilZ domain-containing protein [Acidobacteriota bacterium]
MVLTKAMASRWDNNTSKGSPRAQRFAIHMPIQYRRTGEIGWHEGQVENISRSGVLFQAAQLMDLQALLDLSFELPVEIGGEAGAAVVCRGEVVRRVPPATTDAPAALATKILEYHFLRGRNGLKA